ncbi:MAG: DsbA family protein [Pseudomonadota bacterium]|nr:DsbA family protein [Pseudomonadota bacterium]
MTLEVDFYFSFRSPYSYLAIPQVEALANEYDLRFNMRIVRPIAVRIPGFFKRVNPLWPPYLMRDTRRIADRLGIPYAWPRPDPIVMDVASGEVPAEQPYIYRISRLGVAAEEEGQGLPFVVASSSAIWSGAVEGWQEADHLQRAAARAQLDLARLDDKIASDPAHYDAVIGANEAAQIESGHWGVPLFVFDNEPFFGQDRLEDLLWRLRQHGLTRRA